MTTRSDLLLVRSRRLDSTASGTAPSARPDAFLKGGRALLYPGLALTSLLLLRGPAELPIGDILMAMAGVLGAVSLARRTNWVPGWTLVAGGLTAAGALIASMVSSDLASSLGVGLRLVYMVLVVPWILVTLLTEQRHIVRGVLWLVAGTALTAAGAMLQVLVGDVIPGGITSDNRLTGFTGHVSDLGGITAMGVGATLGAVFAPLPRRHRLLAGTLLGVTATGLLLSGSVSGMLAVVAVLLFLIVQGVIRLRRAVVVGVVGVVGAALALSLLAGAEARDPVERFLVTTGQTSVGVDSNTGGSRLEMASRAVDGIIERPLTGQGLAVPDNVVFREFTVHNNLLAAWHSGGVLMFIGIVIASTIALRYCMVRDPFNPLHSAVSGSVVAALAFAQTAPSVINRYYWLPVAFAVVLAVRSRDGWHAVADASSGPGPATGRLSARPA